MKFLIQKNVSLAEFTTFKIGGRAAFFASAKTEAEVVEALNFANQNNLQIFILGGGSNVLIADEGFDGLVLQVALKGVSISNEQNKIVRVTAKAGEDWDNFVAFCVEKNLQGVECLSGIPGFVGGTPVQNVGAYGQEVAETIAVVKCFDRKRRKIVELTKSECGFNYRTSIFNTVEKNRFVVLAVTYALKNGGAPQIVYKDLINFFGDEKPDLAAARRAVLNIRAEKSMVINSADPNSQSAGSFFKNPIVGIDKFQDVKIRALKLRIENVPSFAIDENSVKIPAAWLIEKSGFQKGFRQGNVGLSTNHTLALVNFGGAQASEIIALKDMIQKKVKEIFDIELTPEPVFVGF